MAVNQILNQKKAAPRRVRPLTVQLKLQRLAI